MDVLLPINTSGDTAVRLYTSNKSNPLSTLIVLYYIVCAFFFLDLRLNVCFNIILGTSRLFSWCC